MVNVRTVMSSSWTVARAAEDTFALTGTESFLRGHLLIGSPFLSQLRESLHKSATGVIVD